MGGEAIEAALREVRSEQRRSASLVSFTARNDSYGNYLPPREDNPEHGKRAARLQSLAAELESLRRSPASPADIEARCAAALAEASAHAGAAIA